VVRNRGRKLWQEVVGEVKLEVKASEIAPFLLLNFLDVERGEDHATFGMVRMGERQESFGEKILIPNLMSRDSWRSASPRSCRGAV
jgi:hypothetical protein